VMCTTWMRQACITELFQNELQSASKKTALLVSFASSVGSILPGDVINDPEEQWTEAPHWHEYVDADSELLKALEKRSENDEEEADDSVERVLMTIKEARKASEALKIFVQENHSEHSELREFKDAVEGLNRMIERMAFFARSRQTTMLDNFPPATKARSEAGGKQAAP